ncbi:hypothetical protein ABB37_01287 [Leptomonas pyrrhocoris]|uniref:Uncharacterized protein n=1 Tax=Leptomonas pyrrhocoris TaxID=157538 RepID=A0A0M9G8Q6_LEPPY|nr:hypothetical protein ABB37_01287 [Leptomonas pyrrhocoris]KPA84806.1 hypothetical protein ABB37_01287 [Leptomonas pyrrhocoris]|eukprot:XP_015663245.1 hypothetical protein ABB37_01287 [Leptomonas pyrrhocoris]
MTSPITSAITQSTNSEESGNASCGTHITLPCELDPTTQTAPSSEMEDQLSLNPSLASSHSTTVPECNSTQCNTPVNAAGVKAVATAFPNLHRVTSVEGCGLHVPEIYKRAAADQQVRAAIAVNVKHVFHSLTGFDVDEIFDLLFVEETWFSAEVVIHALCLVNRISPRFPYWCAHAIESDTDTSSYHDSPIRGGSAAAATVAVSHVCSSTSSDFGHPDNTDVLSEASFDLASRSLARSRSGSTNSLGDVFTRSNSPRCMTALLLLSSKFHGDIVYNTASLSNAVNKFRDEQMKRMVDAPASLSPGLRRRPLLRVLPATLGQCEKRLFRELGCSVFVHKEEYQHCADVVLKGM